MECSEVVQELENMLRNKLVHLDIEIRNHLDTCKTCWSKLVAIRWQIAENTVELIELREFLGRDFIYGCDSSWELAKDWNSKKRDSIDSILDFYENTRWYVYNLTLWSACGQRSQYVKMATQMLRTYAVKSVLDFGSGVGTDALDFAELEFIVETYEINILCNGFFEWRKKRRNLDIVIHSELSSISKEFDLLWSMDVIEHLQEPVAMLSPLLQKCRIFVYDTEFSGSSGGRHPFHFQHDEEELKKAWEELGFTQVEDRKTAKDFKVFVRQ